MKATFQSEFDSFGVKAEGNLVVIDYHEDMEADPLWERFGVNLYADYLGKARDWMREGYGENFEEIIAVPVLVCRLMERRKQ